MNQKKYGLSVKEIYFYVSKDKKKKYFHKVELATVIFFN